MTGFGVPSPHSREEEIEAAEAVAAARQERAELARDGPAPSVEAILRQMGRGPDGYEVAEGPDEWVSASTAGRRALGVEDGDRRA
jgi:hypothetical protein